MEFALRILTIAIVAVIIAVVIIALIIGWGGQSSQFFNEFINFLRTQMP